MLAGSGGGGIQRDVLHPESTYPLRSAKSKVLKRAGETLFEVWALKIELAPRLCTIVEEQVSIGENMSEIWSQQACAPTSDDSSHYAIQFLKIIKEVSERDTFFPKILNKLTCIIIN